MSSGLIKSSDKGIIRNSLGYAKKKKEPYYGLSDVFISFLSLSNKNQNINGPSTTRHIPFNELEPELKQILRQEFIDTPNF